MAELNLSPTEMAALNAVDANALREHIDQCLRERRSSSLRALRLDGCGAYVGSKLRQFDQAIAAHAVAKSAKKLSETEYDVRKAGGDLEHAVQQMKDRAATQEREAQLFVVDDHIAPPSAFSEKLNVRIRFQWRTDPEADWQFGSVTFTHTHIQRPDYLGQAPARKPSRTKQEEQRQEALHHQWDYWKSLCLHAVQDHFRRGGDGSTIPEVVQAKTDPHTNGLNNFSASF